VAKGRACALKRYGAQAGEGLGRLLRAALVSSQKSDVADRRCLFI